MSLADVQLERDKINAANAKRKFEEAYAATISTEEARSIQTRALELTKTVFEDMAKSMAQAIDGVDDETRVHYLLSDAAITHLTDLSEKLRLELPDKQSANAVARAIKPKNLLTVSQWAEHYRIIATGTNMPGPWRNENAPHTIDIMDDMSEHSPVKKVTFKKCSGVSGTEIIRNVHGYWIHHVGTKDFMHTVPTLDLRDRVFNPEFKKMVKESPVLAELIDFKSRDASATKEMVETKLGAQIHKIGANSPESARMLHVPYYTGDEISAYPHNLGGEGSTITLFENRLKTFTRSKILYVSTPTIEGECAITDEYENSDKRVRMIPCPHCNHLHPLEFKNFKFVYDKGQQTGQNKKVVSDCWFECPKCNERIEEHQKAEFLQQGKAKWIPTQPHVKDHRGYTINAFYIQYGLGKTWKQIAQHWVDSQGDDAKLQAFINTYLGETWQDQSEGIESASLLPRLETFENIIKEAPQVIRVAGVDVQKSPGRYEVTVIDFEETEEAWVRQHIIIPAETEHESEWQKLLDELNAWQVQLAFVDSGWNTDMVYDFCGKNKQISVPIKGIPGQSRPLLEDKVKRAQRLRGRKKKKMQPEPLGVDNGKTVLYARLKMDNPTTYTIDQTTGEVVGIKRESKPGYIHFENEPCLDDEYFNQLTAERLTIKRRAGRENYEWKPQKGRRSEALDCFIYALAAFRMAKETATIRYRTMQLNREETTHQSQPTKKPKVVRRIRGRSR